MYEIFVARNELAATFTSSAVARSATTTGVSFSMTGANAARSRVSAQSDWTPKTSLSGCMVSRTAYPSRRNSGFQASSSSSPIGEISCTSRVRRAAVPIGTVDLPTSSAFLVIRLANAVNAAST